LVRSDDEIFQRLAYSNELVGSSRSSKISSRLLEATKTTFFHAKSGMMDSSKKKVGYDGDVADSVLHAYGGTR
jgi:hypothetical protein